MMIPLKKFPKKKIEVGSVGNPVWRAFVSHRMPYLLDFFRNRHIESYIQMIEQFIRLNPYYVPDLDMGGNDSSDLIKRLLWDEEFNQSLSEKGMRVWLSAPFTDFIEELSLYRNDYREFNLLVRLMVRHTLWFERVYAHLRRLMAERYGIQ